MEVWNDLKMKLHGRRSWVIDIAIAVWIWIPAHCGHINDMNRVR